MSFLTRFVEEDDLQQLSEAQASVLSSRFLTGSSRKQFDAEFSEYCTGGIDGGPEIVDYLVGNCATPNYIRKAVHDSRSLRKGTDKAEQKFMARVNRVAHRVGNVFPAEDKITAFNDGLKSVIHKLIACFWESIPRRHLTFTRTVQFARNEGDPEQVRNRAHRATGLHRREAALILEQDDPNVDHASDNQRREELHLLHNAPPHYGDNSSSDNTVLYAQEHLAQPQLVLFHDQAKAH